MVVYRKQYILLMLHPYTFKSETYQTVRICKYFLKIFSSDIQVLYVQQMGCHKIHLFETLAAFLLEKAAAFAIYI